MKIYSNCGQPIQEDNNKKPAEILGDLFEKSNSEMMIIACAKSARKN